MDKQKGFTSSELIVVIVLLIGIVGWIMNIVAIAHANINEISGLLILRIIGIFVAPLGAVLGYF